MLLMLQHVVVRYSAMETSANYKDGGRKLFEPSTSKISNLDTLRGKASKFCPEFLYNHTLGIYKVTIKLVLDKYASVEQIV